MAAVNQDAYFEYAFLLGATSYPFKPGTLKDTHSNKVSEVRSGAALTVQRFINTKHLPGIGVTLFDPSVLSGWTKFGAAESITVVKSCRRQRNDAGGWGTLYRTMALAQGILLPQKLSGKESDPVEISIMAMGIYAAGVCETIDGTACSQVAAADIKQYRIESIAIGGADIENIEAYDAAWEFDPKTQPHAVLPEKVWSGAYNRSGSLSSPDLSEFTAARFLGAVETVVYTFVNLEDSEDTVELDFGNCFIEAEPSGDSLTLNWRKEDSD